MSAKSVAVGCSLDLGPWRVDAFECGRLGLDGGAMFGAVPRVMWEPKIAPDEAHRIPLAMRLLLLRREVGGEVVLVDTGIGEKFDERFAEMFAVRQPELARGQLPLDVALGGLGVSRDQITHVLLTHMHFDHGGGVSYRESDGSLALVFPRAEHFLQRDNFVTATQPNVREKASYLAENVEPLRDGRLTLVEGPAELLPGVSVTPSNGHTQGLQTVRVEGGGRVVYYVADLAPTQHHVHLPFMMGYDLCTRELLEEKRALFARAVDEDAVIVLEHDPHVAAGKVRLDRGRFSLDPGGWES